MILLESDGNIKPTQNTEKDDIKAINKLWDTILAYTHPYTCNIVFVISST